MKSLLLSRSIMHIKRRRTYKSQICDNINNITEDTTKINIFIRKYLRPKYSTDYFWRHYTKLRYVLDMTTKHIFIRDIMNTSYQFNMDFYFKYLLGDVDCNVYLQYILNLKSSEDLCEIILQTNHMLNDEFLMKLVEYDKDYFLPKLYLAGKYIRDQNLLNLILDNTPKSDISKFCTINRNVNSNKLPCLLLQCFDSSFVSQYDDYLIKEVCTNHSLENLITKFKYDFNNNRDLLFRCVIHSPFISYSDFIALKNIDVCLAQLLKSNFGFLTNRYPTYTFTLEPRILEDDSFSSSLVTSILHSTHCDEKILLYFIDYINIKLVLQKNENLTDKFFDAIKNTFMYDDSTKKLVLLTPNTIYKLCYNKSRSYKFLRNLNCWHQEQK